MARSCLYRQFVVAVLCVVLIPTLAWCLPQGTVISNTALATYNLGATTGILSSSNTVTTTTVMVRTPSTLEYMQYAPAVASAEQVPVSATAYSTTGANSGPFVPLPPPIPSGSSTPLDISNPLPLVPANIYHQGDPVFIRLIDLDQNLDPLTAETVLVNITNFSPIENELLLLTETGVNTGVFVGYIQSDYGTAATENDGIVTVASGTEIVAGYVDSSDGSDASSATVLVDPFGIVFDSSTGLPVDGAEVTLFDMASGLPAVVFGEDGLTSFPSTVISGGTATDSGGNSYDFPPGGFRFPFVSPGNYRLDVIPPTGWNYPSAVPSVTLQALPGGPFALVEPGSRGEPFTLNPGPALQIDVPVDPGSTALWVTKTVSQDVASIGDFIQYRLEVQTPTGGVLPDVTLTDKLPHGFRYQSGSLKIEGKKSSNPDISSDGRTLTISLGDLEGDTDTAVRYVVEVAAGSKMGKATNSAYAVSANGIQSNTARAAVKVIEELFRSHSIIMGRVAPGGCQEAEDDANEGLEGVRIYLENGTYAITDERGLYHFEGVRPGVHVVQLDIDSLPAEYEVLACEENSRFAGRSHSQFVDLQGGTMWRADFYVGLKPRLKDNVSMEITSAMQDGFMNYGLNLQGGQVPLEKLRLTIMLPEGSAYVAGSSTLNEEALPDPTISENMLTYRLGDVPGDWSKALRFRAQIDSKGATRELLTKGMLMFDTPSKKNQQTPLVDNVLLRVVEEEQVPQPDKVLLLVPEEKRLRELEIVTYPEFASFSTQLSKQYRGELDTLLKKLKKLDIRHLEVTGHTDNLRIRARSRHIHGDNYALSLARARSVAQYLADRLGIDMSQMTIQGKGPDEPIASNKTAKGRAQNRRVTVNILSEKVVLDIRAASASDNRHKPISDRLDAVVAKNEKQSLESLAKELSQREVTKLYITYEMGPPGASVSGEVSGIGADGSEIVPTDRARMVGQYLTETLGLDPAQIALVPNAQQELTYRGEDSNQGVWNCPVQVRVITNEIKSNTSLQLLKTQDRTVVETEGLRPGETWRPTEPEIEESKSIEDFGKAWIESAEPGLEWLWPEPDYSPAIPSLKVAVKHDPNDTITFLINGKAVEPLNYEGILKNSSGTVAISRWAGIDLPESDNHLEFITHDASGNKTGHLQRLVHYAGGPVHVEMLEEQSNLVVDGKNTPVIAIRLTDKGGYPVREGMVGTFEVDEPYAAQEELDAMEKNPLSGMDRRKPHYIVGKNGTALLRLQSTSPSGEALLKVFMEDGKEEELRVWLKPKPRDWILVGLAEGTVGYNTVTGHMESANKSGVDENLYDDGRIAFFAKGSIKGEWLLTMAYDNKKLNDIQGRNLYQTIDPDTYYTVYGDESQQNYDAPSSGKLYLKIERNQFYALFGDYDTGLTVTELSRYSRSLHGFKSEMKDKQFSYSVFASETDQAFVKDEIRGDGTSGLYYLSRKKIVINSEKIEIEVRDRFQSEKIISNKTLTRHLDYNIDYDDGTLFFKEPIYSKDSELNPIYIVVDYESNDSNDKKLTYGGRGAVKLMEDALEVGATYIHEGLTGADADLGGMDATLNLGLNTEIKVEIATSEREESGSKSSGDAYLAELTHRSDKFDGQLYLREEEPGFGLGQQNASEEGMRKMGATAMYRLTNKLNVYGNVYRDRNLDTDAKRDLGEINLNYTVGKTTLHTGLRHAEDRFTDEETNISDQIFAGASQRMFHDRLQLRLGREQSLGSNNDNPDFPTRTTLGADFNLTESVVLFGEQEFTQGAYEDTQETRLGMKVIPWSGGEVNTSVEQQTNEYGPRTYANLGLTQTLNINKKWAIDAGLDHSRKVNESKNTPDNVYDDDSYGNDNDFTAVSMGAAYREENWSWTSRTEYRTTDSQNKWGITTGMYSEPVTDIALTSGIQIFRTDSENGADTTDADLRLGLAYRPVKTRWIFLDRLDFKVDEQDDNDGEIENWRIVNNMNLNYKPNHKAQFSFQYGLKFVKDTIDNDEYTGYTDLTGLEARYDITKRWDVGVHGSVLHSWNSDQFDYSTGVSIGCNVVENAWVSLGYNLLGFEDDDFSRGHFTAQGPFVKFRMKFDQDSVRDILKAW